MVAPTQSREAARAWIKEYTKCHDDLSASNIPNFYTSDAVMVFSNSPPVEGRDNIHAHFTKTFPLFESLRHEIVDVDVSGDKIFLTAKISYEIKNDPAKESITLPAVGIFYMAPPGGEDEGKARKFEAYLDGSPVMKKVVEVMAAAAAAGTAGGP